MSRTTPPRWPPCKDSLPHFARAGAFGLETSPLSYKNAPVRNTYNEERNVLLTKGLFKYTGFDNKPC